MRSSTAAVLPLSWLRVFRSVEDRQSTLEPERTRLVWSSSAGVGRCCSGIGSDGNVSLLWHLKQSK